MKIVPVAGKLPATRAAVDRFLPLHASCVWA